MEKLKDLLKNKNQVWFFIENNKKSKTAFLNWAKQNHCKWKDKKIEPLEDSCGIFMGINKNLTLGYVGCHCWFNGKNLPQKINFYKQIGEKL